MQSKFFKRRPIRGMPIAGIEAGALAAMDHAWATMRGRGCKIDWSMGTPTVVVESTSRFTHSFMPVPYVAVDEEEETSTLELKALGGFVFFGGTWYFIDEFFIGGTGAATHWWIKIDDESPEDVQITVESGSAWPTTAGLKFVRLFEFGEAGNLASVIRRTTNDIIYGGGEGADPPSGVDEWRVSRSVTTEGEAETTSLTVRPGLRSVIGGRQTVEPQTHTIELSEEQAAAGVWVVKQFSTVVNGWVQGVQVIAMDDEYLVPVKDTVRQDEIRGSEYIDVIGGGEEKKGELLDVSYRLFPKNLQRQYRVIASVSAEGVVTQYAYGTIYAIGDPEKVDRIVDAPEDEVDTSEEEKECDQNTYPEEGLDDDDPFDDDFGDFPFLPDDPDDDSHPSVPDCFTSN
jgi:hypothetical protein